MRFTFAYSTILAQNNCLSHTFFPLCHSQLISDGDLVFSRYRTGENGLIGFKEPRTRAFSQDKFSRLSGCANKILVSVIAPNARIVYLVSPTGYPFDRVIRISVYDYAADSIFDNNAMIRLSLLALFILKLQRIVCR